MARFGEEYARRNYDLDTDERHSNERAAHALVTLLGGFEGAKVRGIGFPQLTHIMEASPDDDLSGLRLLAERMDYGFGWTVEDNWSQEQPLEPSTAKRWLIGTGRVIEVTEGGLIPLETNHLTLSGLAIVNSGIPGRLSEAYRSITDNPFPFTEQVLAEMSWNIIESYTNTEQI